MMKLERLEIKRMGKYDPKEGQLCGEVELKGEEGSQIVVLSASGMMALISCIQVEVQASAKRNAAMVPHALDDASQGALLLETDGQVKVNNDIPF
jgi:hypothetical protein